jgi:asparagine synthase (glutamine-hydrolysing)
MCGIAGFLTPSSQSPSAAKAMGNRMKHRGPDGAGEWIHKGLHLIHRRLSIVDLNQGHQPMEGDNGSVVVFNGEIYNHLELREDHFQSQTFKTQCDTEILLHGYQKWGKALPQHLNGMFAFGVFEPKSQKLFLARDRLGQKPLYYTKNGNRFAFASEIPALLELDWVDRRLDPNALGQYFAHEHVPCPKTPFVSIHKLPPGHHLTLDCQSTDFIVERWWKPSFIVDPSLKDPNLAMEAFEEKWNRSLRYRMMSDVPLGVFLSGGMDSSSCLAQLTQLYPEVSLKSFSVGFSNKSFDESSYAQLVSQHLGSEHFSAQLKPNDMLDILPKIENHMLDPIADGSIIPTTLLCAHARKNVTVAIGGDGADELLCGYPTFRAHRSLGNRPWPNGFVSFMKKLAGLLPTNMDNLSLDFKIKQTLKGLPYANPIRNEVWLGAGSPEFIKKLFSQDMGWTPPQLYHHDIELWRQSDGPCLLSKVQELYLGGYLNDGILTKVDRASMINSLEVRAPFLDVHLVEFFNALPMHFKIKGNRDKIILRDLMAPRLPAQISQRPKKGFGMPISHWFRAELKDLLWQRIEEAPELFNKTFLKEMFNEHQKGQVDHRKALFSFFMLNPVLKAGNLP